MVLILMRGEYDGGDAGHAVLAFGYRQVSDREIAIRVYDSNHVTSSSSMQETTLTITRNSAGGNYTSWSYPSLGWGTGRRYNSIGYTTLSDIQSVWNQRGSLGNDNMNLFSTNEDSFSMYDFTGRLVLQYEDGVIVQRSADIIELELSNVLPGGGTADVPNMFYAPIDLYTVVDGTPETPMEISMSDFEMAIELSTGADRFDLCADDYSRIANVIMTPDAGDEYSVKLLSTLSGSLEEISLEGMGTGAPISIALENGELSILGAESAELSITMPEDEYFIEAQAETGGTVTPEGITAYAPGENIMYTISADEGYRIGAVYVDGEDVGPVDSYCFENISRSHTIYAVFVRSMNRFTVTPAANEYSFTGAEIRPAIEVADADGNMLTEGVDYTVSYGNNTDIGTATVYAIAVPGSGYYGSAMATFEIVHGETRFISADAGADGTVSLVFDHTGDITVVLAAYGADGSMIEAATEHVSAGVNTAQITLSAAAMNGADRIKAFMADSDFRPLCRPIEINIP